MDKTQPHKSRRTSWVSLINILLGLQDITRGVLHKLHNQCTHRNSDVTAVQYMYGGLGLREAEPCLHLQRVVQPHPGRPHPG